MRRIAALAALTLTLLTAAACDSGSKEPTSSGPTGAPTTAAASADTTEACAAFKKIFAQERMTQFGIPVGQYLAYRKAGDATNAKKAEAKVKAEFDKLSADISKIGAESGDAAFKAKMDQVAAEIDKSKDLKFLDGVDKAEDLQQPFTTMLTAWILPVATTCDMS